MAKYWYIIVVWKNCGYEKNCASWKLSKNICMWVLPVLKIRIIFHVRDLWKLARICKGCLLCPPDPWNLPGTALVSGFQSSTWNILSKTVLSKCSFIWNKWPVNIWNDLKLKSNMHVGPVNIFPNSLWRHQMETFSALLALRWIPRTQASDAELWCFLWSAPN